MAAVFGDVRLDGRQLRDLMPSRLADHRARSRGQGTSVDTQNRPLVDTAKPAIN